MPTFQKSNSHLSVLFIAYFYPPTRSTGVPGSMRTVKFVRALDEINAHVLTSPASVEASEDALKHLSLPVRSEDIHRVGSFDLFKLLLSLKKILKRQAPSQSSSSSVFKSSESDFSSFRPSYFQRIKDFIYDACYFPDQAGPWIIPAVVRGARVVRKHKIDVIFATGSPWSSLIIGCFLSRLCRKPLVIDFRDPWMNNPFHKSKGKFLDWLGRRLERMVVHRADAISLNTQPLLEEFSARYPESAEKLFVMPNGFDREEFKGIPDKKSTKRNADLVLCHAGLLYGVRDPSVLLDAIRIVNQKRKEASGKVVFHQIGYVQLNYDLKERYRDLIAAESLVIESPVPYKDCLNKLASADVVVNIQPGTKTQIPSKLYDYLALRQPILNITPKDGALGKLVSSNGLGELFDFDEVDSLADALASKLEGTSNSDFKGYEKAADFEIYAIATKLQAKLEQLAKT